MALLLSYGMVIVFFIAMETALIFPAPDEPPAVMAEAAAREGAQEIWLDSDDGETLYGWRIGTGDRLVILFTGNGSGVGLEPDRYRLFEDMGWAVLHVNYPGYPGSTGNPLKRVLRPPDVRHGRRPLRTHTPDQIVLAGKSLGGFAVISLAADLSQAGGPVPHGMIVESSFSSVMDVASEHYPWLPVRWFLQNKMISVDKAGQGDLSCSAIARHWRMNSFFRIIRNGCMRPFRIVIWWRYRVKGTMKTWANIRGVRQPSVRLLEL